MELLKSSRFLAGAGMEKKIMSYTLSALESFYGQLEKVKFIKTVNTEVTNCCLVVLEMLKYFSDY